MKSGNLVARYLDGKIVKGHSVDFRHDKTSFHIQPEEPGARPVKVRLAQLKAVFIVKSFKGNPGYTEKKDFALARGKYGFLTRVRFQDGEVMVGTVQNYQPHAQGFFLFPVDPGSNTLKAFVLSEAVDEIKFVERRATLR